ncbi:MAG TPA: hypothetical protein PLJ00_15770 [Chitinophagales bacterium]|nr:hypothetical protein [Chitinophagales bacterium]
MIYKETKYLVFEERIQIANKKTKLITVTNKSGQVLGAIHWERGWRKYVFNCNADIIFDAGCLNDIATFLTDLMTEQKNAMLQKRQLKRIEIKSSETQSAEWRKNNL